MNRSQNGLGEEAHIRDLLDQFKESIMKTGEDLNMLAGKFDSDLKKSCKSKLEKHMKTLVELESRLAMEKDASSQAMSHIGCAFNGWNDCQSDGNFTGWESWPTNDNPNNEQTDEQAMDCDEDGEPIASENPTERPSNPEYDKILNDEKFDLFQEVLIKLKSRKTRRKQDARIKALKTLLTQKPGNNNTGGDDGGEEEEEIIASTQDTIPIDPITKKKITDPVKNVKCGHIYDKNGIADFLKAPNPRCPYMGCVNRAQIRPTDLVEDDELKQKIDYLMALEAADEESESEAE